MGIPNENINQKFDRSLHLEKKKSKATLPFHFSQTKINKLKNLIENLGSENGVRFVIIELQKLYLKDESFELAKSRKSLKFSMPSDITIPVTIFEQQYQVGMSHEMKVLDEVLAYWLLNNADL